MRLTLPVRATEPRAARIIETRMLAGVSCLLCSLVKCMCEVCCESDLRFVLITVKVRVRVRECECELSKSFGKKDELGGRMPRYLKSRGSEVLVLEHTTGSCRIMGERVEQWRKGLGQKVS